MTNKSADPFVEPTDEFLNTTLMLSLQRALLDAVSPSLRGVTCGWFETEIKIRYIFDGPIDPDEHEDMLVAGTEVISDFPAPWTIDDQVVRLDHPASLMPHSLRAWVYRRKEAPHEGGYGQTPATGGSHDAD